MHVGVAYAEPGQQVWLRLEVPDGSTVRDAIEQSGVLDRFPHIDLGNQKIGIFGKMAKLDAPLKEGDRVEIYRAITADPKTVPRRDRGEDED
jgi:putative ubiquitin-RnfH superfamily antitoxin RatB of RatAB toxin-antitoxin module